MEGKMNKPAETASKTNPKAANENDTSDNPDEKMEIVKKVLKKQFRDGDESLVEAFYSQITADQVEEYKKSESFRDETEKALAEVIEETDKQAEEKEKKLIDKEVKKIVPIMERIAKARKKTLIDYIALGKIILTAKQLIDSEKLDAALTEDIISKRQRQRYVKLVVSPSDYEAFATLGANPSPDDYAKIKMDQRVLGLTEKSIAKFRHASMTKLGEIKLFKDNDKYLKEYGSDNVFDLIIGGNEKVYEAEVAAKTGGTTESNDDLPEGLTEKKLKETMKEGARALSIKVYELEKANSELAKKVEDLDSDMKSFRKQNRLQIVEGAKEKIPA